MANLRVKIEHCSMVFSFHGSCPWCDSDAAAAYREKNPPPQRPSDEKCDRPLFSGTGQAKTWTKFTFPVSQKNTIQQGPSNYWGVNKVFFVFFFVLEGCVSIINIDIKVLQMTKPTSKGLESCKHQQKTATNTPRVANNNSIQALKKHPTETRKKTVSVRKTLSWNVTVRFKWRLRKMVTSRSPVKEGHSAFF